MLFCVSGRASIRLCFCRTRGCLSLEVQLGKCILNRKSCSFCCLRWVSKAEQTWPLTFKSTQKFYHTFSWAKMFLLLSQIHSLKWVSCVPLCVCYCLSWGSGNGVWNLEILKKIMAPSPRSPRVIPGFCLSDEGRTSDRAAEGGSAFLLPCPFACI